MRWRWQRWPELFEFSRCTHIYHLHSSPIPNRMFSVNKLLANLHVFDCLGLRGSLMGRILWGIEAQDPIFYVNNGSMTVEIMICASFSFRSTVLDAWCETLPALQSSTSSVKFWFKPGSIILHLGPRNICSCGWHHNVNAVERGIEEASFSMSGTSRIVG